IETPTVCSCPWLLSPGSKPPPWFHMPGSVPFPESPPSHSIGNPTDTSEIPKIPVGDKDFAKFLDANPSA
ncbi:hypothetical protein KI387_040399, partial [Taxus chinensis]